MAPLATDAHEWEIETQVRYVDLYITNKDADLAIIVENKINAPLGNPIKKYVRHALREGNSNVVMVVLAPDEREHMDQKMRPWVSASITYTACRRNSSIRGSSASRSQSNRYEPAPQHGPAAAVHRSPHNGRFCGRPTRTRELHPRMAQVSTR